MSNLAQSRGHHKAPTLLLGAINNLKELLRLDEFPDTANQGMLRAAIRNIEHLLEIRKADFVLGRHKVEADLASNWDLPGEDGLPAFPPLSRGVAQVRIDGPHFEEWSC